MIPTSYRHASAALLVLLGSAWSAPAQACKCRLQSVDEAKQDAVAIFEGRVVSVVDEPKTEANMFPGKSVTIALVRTWRGFEDQEAVTVRTAEASATCGYAFEVGKSYLVYAAGDGDKGDKLLVTSCSRTRPLSDAGEDLAALGGGITPVKIEPAQDAGASPPPPKTKSGGCASSKGQASASLWWLGAPALGFAVRRRRTG